MECKEIAYEPLPYAYNALEPYLSEELLREHHDVLYKKYVDNLNKVIKNNPELCGLSSEQLILMLPNLPADISKAIYNFAGGVYNHQQYFEMMTPPPNERPTGELMAVINKHFGSFDNFQEAFKRKAMQVFGSGWTWLAVNQSGELEIVNTTNQGTPFSLNMAPIIGIDIWEHAYCIQYKANRSDYIGAWLKVANWKKASEMFAGY
ncbi:superoxide dismutase [Anaerovorax odorimutans]|uniref:superoxide dismutase n=1 Tax=Anaerovorax odorimutans TaxID=109327 RepID=UPI0003F5B385|nr:superoxide dismutase [Anaerovorax odorimutans]